MISAVYSRFSGVLSGGSVCRETQVNQSSSPFHFSCHQSQAELRSHQQEVVVFRFCPQILEDDLLHESLHQVPVLHDAMTDRPLDRKKKHKHQQLVKSEGNDIMSVIYLCRIRRFVDGFVPDEEVQVVDTPHHSALGLVTNFGRFFDGDTFR